MLIPPRRSALFCPEARIKLFGGVKLLHGTIPFRRYDASQEASVSVVTSHQGVTPRRCDMSHSRYLVATETIALSLPPLTRQIDQEVRSGQLAYLLGRPCNYVLYHFAQYLGERLVRLVTNIPVAATLALVFVGVPNFTWMGVVAWPLVVLLAVSIDFVVYFSIGLLAFWTEETTPFFLIVNRLALVLGGVLAPLEVLPQPIRAISQVLPFSAVLYGPARTLVHFQWAHFGWLLFQQGITLAIGSLVLLAIYWAATRRVNINGG